MTESLKPSSAPLHTDKQDVIAIQVEASAPSLISLTPSGLQAQGSKRWRIYMPPHPANKVMVCHASACTSVEEEAFDSKILSRAEREMTS